MKFFFPTVEQAVKNEGEPAVETIDVMPEDINVDEEEDEIFECTVHGAKAGSKSMDAASRRGSS